MCVPYPLPYLTLLFLSSLPFPLSFSFHLCSLTSPFPNLSLLVPYSLPFLNLLSLFSFLLPSPLLILSFWVSYPLLPSLPQFCHTLSPSPTLSLAYSLFVPYPLPSLTLLSLSSTLSLIQPILSLSPTFSLTYTFFPCPLPSPLPTLFCPLPNPSFPSFTLLPFSLPKTSIPVPYPFPYPTLSFFVPFLLPYLIFLVLSLTLSLTLLFSFCPLPFPLSFSLLLYSLASPLPIFPFLVPVRLPYLNILSIISLSTPSFAVPYPWLSPIQSHFSYKHIKFT